ncbi:hypothetical protein [Actinoallomurus acaciae]|uniref:Secreted protein n=1 Tax=Actinoallomurus acaciae TaxID=502577 RepID=A0ABV5YR11_9ACTN
MLGRHKGGALYAMVFLFTAMGCLTAAPESRASTRTGPAAMPGMHWGDSDQHNGNGRHNRISAPFNSPNNIRGVQTIINANSGGATVTQTQLCKRRVRCRLRENSHLVIR